MIIDTDVLIWELRGNIKAYQLIHENIPFSISVITYMELVQGMRNKKELNTFIRQMTQWKTKIRQINSDISTRAMIYIETFFLSHSMELADALIAATAVDGREALITANDKHYRHIADLRLIKFSL